MPRDRARILGCEIDRLDMEATVERCAEIIDAGEPTQHVAINVAKVVALEDDPRLRDVVERCELVSVDGQPIVWASRLLGDPLPERVAGIDLMFRLLELAEERGYRVYILGREAGGARDRDRAPRRALSRASSSRATTTATSRTRRAPRSASSCGRLSPTSSSSP